MKRVIHNLSIRQNILFSTLAMVSISLLLSSIFYYAAFSRSSKTLVESQSREINKQIILNYENYINSIIETTNYLQISFFGKDLQDARESLQNIFTYSAEVKKDVVSIGLFDTEGRELLSGGRSSFEADRNWAMRALYDEQIFHFSSPYPLQKEGGPDEQVISVSKTMNFREGGTDRKGILLITLNFNSIIALAKQTNLGQGGHILILGEDDSLIYSSIALDSPIFAKSLELASGFHFGGKTGLIEKQEMAINSNTLAQTRWRIVTVNNIDDIAKARNSMIMVLLIILVVSLTATMLLAAIISSSISKPLKQMEKWISRIEAGDFDSPVKVSGQKEIVSVANSFNNMVEKLKKLMVEVVDEQRSKRKSELAALQNQITPHFLYNTLDSIVWLSENNRNADVVTTVVALARFFRISISRGKNFIPVRDEIAHVENYLTIQKIRYANKFEYKFEVDEKAYSYDVMKLILQPLVENAIYHGGTDGGKAMIIIRCYEADGFLVFEVENSGYGITQEKIDEIYAQIRDTKAGEGVGLRNVYQRLKIYYGEKSEVFISSELDEKTVIKLVIPLRETLT